MTDYVFKTIPFTHQRQLFEETRDTPRFGIFWEQGTGKTKLTLDTAAWLYQTGKIDGLLVVAPNGVHRNWTVDEIPAHLPDSVPRFAHCYHADKATQKKHQQACVHLLGFRGLSILAMSYDATITSAGKDLLGKFLSSRKCLYVLDEATRIKTPSAKRTKAILASAKDANYRRVLTGTPIANSPFDIYTIMKFLDLEFWKPYYLDSFFVFKHQFGKFRPGNVGGRQFEIVVGYRNLDQLKKIIQKHSSRVTKDEVLDLPPKLYTKRYFTMNPEQQRVYNELRDEFMTFLDGELVTAPLVITRMIRLQQVTSGYIPFDGGDPIAMLGESNPRMKLLEDVMEDIPGKVIIWAKFTRDIDQILALLGNRAVRYDGSVSNDARGAAIERFQRGDAQAFVINNSMCEGLTLTAADTTIYYNNTFKLTDRLQSEDRNHRHGTTKPVTYIDLVAEETIDEHIVKALVKKKDVASLVMGDTIREWL